MTILACIGSGRIGGEVAFLSAKLGLVDEIILHDNYESVLTAQQLDISHSIDIPITTDTSKIRDADICVFSAGTARTPDIKTRADLFDINMPVARESMKILNGFGGTMIVVTNPMDVFTWYFAKNTGLDQEQVIGFGGLLDSRRFELALKSIGIEGDARVLGEHGEHQVPIYSRINTEIPISTREKILSDLRGSSMPIIKGKSGTIFGPASHICDMINDIFNDTHRLITCSIPPDGAYGIDGCSIGLPVRLGKDKYIIEDNWTLDTWEQTKLQEASEYIKKMCMNI